MTKAKKDIKVKVVDQAGKSCGEMSLNAEIFGAPVNQRLLDLVQTAYAANQREGNASTKTRKEVRGGGKKPWRQKGTGRARHGSSRSPIWRGGGTVFGPHTRDYRVDLPKTMRLEALRSALSLRAKQDRVTVLADLNVAEPKTKIVAGVIENLKMGGKKLLCVVDQAAANLKKASRNLSNLTLAESKDVTAYDIMRKGQLVISKAGISAIEKRFTEK